MAYGVITTDKNGISNSFNNFKTTLSLDTVSLPIKSQLVITNSLFIANKVFELNPRRLTPAHRLADEHERHDA